MTYTIARNRHELQRHNRSVRSGVQRQLGLDPWPPRASRPPGAPAAGAGIEAQRWHPHPGAEATLWLAAPTEGVTRNLFILLIQSDRGPEGWEEEFMLAAASAGHMAAACPPAGHYRPALGLQPATVAAVQVVALCDALLGRGRRQSAVLAGSGAAAAVAVQLAAVDERIRGLVLHEPQAGTYPGPIKTFADASVPFADLLRLRAPWPLVWCGRIERAHRHALNSAYRLWDQPDRLQILVEAEASRLVALATPASWTAEPEAPAERRPAQLPGAAQPQAAPVEIWVEEWSRRRLQLSPPQIEKRSSRRTYMQERLDALSILVAVPSGEVEVALEDAESLQPAAPHEQRPGLVIIEETGESESWGRGLLERIPPATLVRRLHYSAGSDAAPLVREALRLVEELYGLTALQHESISIVGVGKGGPIALAAAALEPRFSRAVVDACGALYSEDEAPLPVLPEILRVGDLPQLGALRAPRPLFIHHAAAGRTGFSSRRFYDWTRRTYQSEQAEANLKLQEAPASPDEVSDWLLAPAGALASRG